MSSEIELDSKVPGTGSTVRENLRFARPDDKRLKEPELSDYESYIMAVFWMLHRDRPQHFGGPGSLTLQSMISYQELFEDRLNTDDISVIHGVDRAFLKALNEKQEK